MKASIKIVKGRRDEKHKQESNESKTSEAKKSAERSTSEMVSSVKSWIVELQQQAFFAVIFLALYAVKFSMFCSNDCFSADHAVYSLEGVVCSG